MAGTPLPVETQQDFQKIPLLGVVLETLSADVDPATNVGRVYILESTGRVRHVRTATTITNLDLAGLIVSGDLSATAGILMSQLAINPTARSTHTGTQVASTISDLATAVQAYAISAFAAATADLVLGGHKITAVGDGSAADDAAAWGQVQNLVNSLLTGQSWKSPGARVASDTNVNIASAPANIDGVTMAAGESAVLNGQTTATENGLYDYNGSGIAMTRRADANSNAEVKAGMTVPIQEGTHQDDLAILATNNPITLGTTPLSFIFIRGAGAYSGSATVQIVGNVVSLVTPVTVANGGTGSATASGARTNLNTPQRGLAADIPALVAGVGTDVAHNLGTLDVAIDVYRKSDGTTIPLIGKTRKDVNTVTITADVAVAANALRVVVTPVQ